MDTGFNQAELSRLVANLIRIGTVSDVDYAKARIRVQIAEIRTDWVPWIEARAGTDVSWWAPEPGEQVMVLSPGGDTAQAVALPALFRAAAPPPADTADKRRVTFADGASVEYDRAAHVLTIALAIVNGRRGRLRDLFDTQLATAAGRASINVAAERVAAARLVTTVTIRRQQAQAIREPKRTVFYVPAIIT